MYLKSNFVLIAYLHSRKYCILAKFISRIFFSGKTRSRKMRSRNFRSGKTHTSGQKWHKIIILLLLPRSSLNPLYTLKDWYLDGSVVRILLDDVVQSVKNRFTLFLALLFFFCYFLFNLSLVSLFWSTLFAFTPSLKNNNVLKSNVALFTIFFNAYPMHFSGRELPSPAFRSPKNALHKLWPLFWAFSHVSYFLKVQSNSVPRCCSL